MTEYHKIQSVFKRDPENKFKTFIDMDWSLPEFGYLQRNQWVFTEKVDGTNIRVIFDGHDYEFGGRTDRAQIPATLYSALNELIHPKIGELRDKFPDGCVLYGEGYGAKIQKGGGNYRPDQSFVLFDVKVGDFWLEENNVIDVSESLDLDVVPVIGEGSLLEAIEYCRAGFDSRWGDFRAEGIVARPKTELRTRNGSRIITKVKCKDFQ